MRYIVCTCIVGLLLTCSVFGQVSRGGMPLSGNDDRAVYHEAMPEFINLPTAETPDRNEQPTYPLYAGYTVHFNQDGHHRGIWTKAGNDGFIWRIGVHVAGAKAMNIYLEKLNLKSGDRLFIYHPDKEFMLGAFTEVNNDAYFGTAWVPGDSLVIELNRETNDRDLPFSINSVGVAVNPVSESQRDFGDSDDCEVLMNCPEGVNMQKEKRGVARVLVKEGSSLFWCTGSLVNNTSRDRTPYFLTAHHCGEGSSDEDLSAWVFYFNFESANCEKPVTEPQHQSLSGARLIADGKKTSLGSDFKLLLLEEDIPKQYAPYFNGWSRVIEPSASGVGIHHPEGDMKMVSTYTEPLESVAYNNPVPDPEGRFWMVYWSQTESGHGVTEPGSSGSPLFSNEGYIVGTLSGGRASCTNLTQPDYYGKFSEHWENNGADSSNQLMPWLDPTDSDVPSLRGLDRDSSSIIADFYSDKTLITVGGSIRYTNNSQGDITQYKWEFMGGEPAFAETETPPAVTYNKTGDYDVKLIVRSSDDTDSLIFKSYIHVVPNLYPNPSADGKFNVVFGQTIPEDLKIMVYSIDGRTVQYNVRQNSELSITLDLSGHPQGIYIIRIISAGKVQTLKAANKVFTDAE